MVVAMMPPETARRLLAEPYPTLETALAAGIELARGGCRVLLATPTRIGDTWTVARVVDPRSGLSLGYLEWRQ